jgi:hypothetical protein
MQPTAGLFAELLVLSPPILLGVIHVISLRDVSYKGKYLLSIFQNELDGN